MSIDNWTKLLEVVISFLQAISWPLIILFILIPLRVPFKKLLQDQNVRNLSFKAGPTGFEATFQRQQQQQIEAAALLGAASVSKENGAPSYTQQLDKDKVKGLVYVVSGTDTLLMAQLLAKTSVLWITVRPEEDMYVKRALEAIGIQVTSVSMHEAIQHWKAGKYDAIIFVMQRVSDYEQLLYPILKEIREQDSTTPTIIYSMADLSNYPQFPTELRRSGIIVETEPTALFERIIEPIRRIYLQQLDSGRGVRLAPLSTSRGVK